MKFAEVEVDPFGFPLLAEKANVPPRIHELSVDVKLQLLQPGKRVYQHADERVKVFRGNPSDDTQTFTVSLREDPESIEFLQGTVFLSKKDFETVLEGVKKYRIPFLIFWYSPGMDLDELKALMMQVDAGTLSEIPKIIRDKMHD